MKNHLWLTGLFVLGIILVSSSCKKKDDTHVSLNQVNGTFHAFEVKSNGATTPFPTEDEKMDVSIKNIDNEHAKVFVIDLYKDNKDTLLPITCTIGKTEDGFTILNKQTSTGYIEVLFYDKNTIEFMTAGADHDIDIGASKNGKKPDWWN